MSFFDFIERKNRKYSLVGDKPIFDNELFLFIPEIESNFPAIRRELDSILMTPGNIPSFQDVLQEENLTTRENWKSFFFYLFGHTIHENCKRCPITTRTLKLIPGMRTAFFSILKPNVHLPAHRGPFNGVLRYHLGLKIPAKAQNCLIRVHNSFASWECGKSIVFDDSYDHEVWNNTDEERVVLFVDFLRPLPVWLSIVNKLCLFLSKYLIKEVREGKKYLEKADIRP